MGSIHGAWPGTRVIVMGVLPRGTDYWNGGSDRFLWPNALTPGISALNNALQVCKSFHPSSAALLFIAQQQPLHTTRSLPGAEKEDMAHS